MAPISPLPGHELAKTQTLTQDAASAAIAWPSAKISPMICSMQSPVLLRINLLWFIAGLPLAKAIEPPLALPVLVQLESQALVPFYLDQKQAGLDDAKLGQAVKRQAKRLSNEQGTLAKRIEADGARVTQRYSRLVNALRVRVAPESMAALAKRAGVKRVERLRIYEPLTAKSVPAIGAKAAWGTRTTSYDGKGMRIAVIDLSLIHI